MISYSQETRLNSYLLFQPNTAEKMLCYTYKLKYVFQLEENVSRVVGQSSLTPKGNNLNFRLPRDQVVLFETAANLWASRRQANDFFAVFFYFWVGRYNKTLNDRSRGKQWVLFPLDLNVPLDLSLVYTTLVNSAFYVFWLFDSEVIIFTCICRFISRNKTFF